MHLNHTEEENVYQTAILQLDLSQESVEMFFYLNAVIKEM